MVGRRAHEHRRGRRRVQRRRDRGDRAPAGEAAALTRAAAPPRARAPRLRRARPAAPRRTRYATHQPCDGPSPHQVAEGALLCRIPKAAILSPRTTAIAALLEEERIGHGLVRGFENPPRGCRTQRRRRARVIASSAQRRRAAAAAGCGPASTSRRGRARACVRVRLGAARACRSAPRAPRRAPARRAQALTIAAMYEASIGGRSKWWARCCSRRWRRP